ncbi:MAG TPA: rod shape-determining protein MreC [Deltaproteobacteria bacterium]|nr:rod shape-determining protein MreC [Deltaproteobacteria bacterium]
MKGRTKLPLFIVTSVLILVLISFGQQRYPAAALGLVREGYSWVVRLAEAPLDFASGIWNNYIYLINARQENAALRAKVNALEARTMAFGEVRRENMRLRALLDFKTAYPDLPLVPAEVLGQDISLVFKTLVLDKGSADGFFKDMPVMKPGGIVGRVIAVTPHSAQVLLITDVNSAVPAVIENSRVKGIVKGRGDGSLSLEYVKSDEEVKVGDLVVSSGLGGIFPRGITIGSVRSVKRPRHKMFAEILLKPGVEIGQIEEVFGIGRDVAYLR